MTVYLDTSVVVALLTHEARSPETRSLVGGWAGQFATSNWVRAEFSAALSMKFRTRQMTGDERAVSEGEFLRLLRESLTRVTVRNRHFLEAAALAARSSSGLRAGDALHLAIAADQEATVWTLDKAMAKAGTELHLPVELI